MKLWDITVNALCRLLCAVFFWRFRIIPKARDPQVPLLRQLLLWKSSKLEVYLQHFDNPEDPEFMHCHEWPTMRSFVLSDTFTEERQYRAVEHKRFTTYTMDRSVWHRTDSWGKNCWTLFVCTGGRTVARGYRKLEMRGLNPRALGPFIPWRDHILQRVPSLTGIETP